MSIKSFILENKKTAAGALAGAITTVIVWIINVFELLPDGVQVPGEIAAAITTILTAIVSYFVKSSHVGTTIES